MREIKFRAWDKNQKVMRTICNIHFNMDDKAQFLYDDENKEGYWCHSCELMQYTGLKDKNGKEIYEGDIVKYYDSTTMWLEANIKWLGACFGVETTENPIPLYEFLDQYIYEKTPARILEIEIIGNIHSNPELLK